MHKQREYQAGSSQGRRRFQEETGGYLIEYLLLLVFILMGFVGIGEVFQIAAHSRGEAAIGKGDVDGIYWDSSTYQGLETGLPCFKAGKYENVAFRNDGCK